jgi:hypothetical protein
MRNKANPAGPPEKAALPEDIGMYLDTVRQQYPAIGQVFVLARNGSDRGAVPWSLLAFADEAVLAAMRKNTDLRREELDMLIVTDGDRFESVWGSQPPGSLADMRWQLADPDTATYRGADGEATAMRVR